ncbi:MAG: gliding motility-associated-like protein [Limisphaerales bacterium]|jgi:gliding motility-associated-like protein
MQGQFVLNGDATDIGGGCYRLTPAAPTSSGSAWYPDLIDLSNSFTLSTRMNFGNLDFSGADGMAFVLQPISTALGSGGGGMGYLGISPSIDIEFDTYQNGAYGDPSSDHVAINSNGNPSHFGASPLTSPVNILSTSVNAEDGAYHQVLFQWDVPTLTLSVTVDCVLRTSYTGDIVSTIFSGDPLVYIGFTAGTGALFNQQIICFDYLQLALPATEVSACEGELVMLQAPFGFSGYNWTPTTGLDDPTSATPSLTATTSTLYTVSFSDACGHVFYDSVDLLVAPLPVFDLGNDTTLCGAATLTLNAPSSLGTINWSDGSTGTTLTVSADGIYWLDAGVLGCEGRDSITVSYFSPTIDLGVDSEICAGDSVLIGIADAGLNYNWNTGEVVSEIWVSEEGTYSLTVSQDICTVTDDFELTVQTIPTVFLPDSMAWCPDESVFLQVSGDAISYVWSTGEPGAFIEADMPGDFWIEGQSGSCINRDTISVYENVFCFCDPIFPNAFTPNSDGLNDQFKALNVEVCPFVSGYLLEVYDRNGELVFSATDPLLGWDGSIKGKDAELGTYLFYASYEFTLNEEVLESGTVTLIR